MPTTAFVVSLNLHRRHLDESQRAKVAAKIANLQNGQKASSANLQSTGVSQSRAAELLNVGTRTWPTGSLHWADTPEARLMTGTKPGHVPGVLLPAVWLAELAGGDESPS